MFFEKAIKPVFPSIHSSEKLIDPRYPIAKPGIPKGVLDTPFEGRRFIVGR